MDCIKDGKQGAEILLDYSAGTLDPARSGELTAHIRECRECAALVEAQSTVWETLDAWKPVEVSPDFDAKLYARIAQEDSVPAWRQWLSRRWKPAVPLAALAAVLALALLIRVPDGDDRIPSSTAKTAPVVQIQGVQVQVTAPAPAQAHSGNIDVDQVEQALEDLDLMAPSAM